MTTPYVLRLAARLAEGLARRPAEFRDRHRAFFARQQRPDGGFAGREGGSDLYYTSFAVRGLSLLDGMDERIAAGLADYLRATASAPTGIVDLMSWLYSALAVGMAGGPNLLEHADDAWNASLAGWLESFRTDDGGYAKGADGVVGSTYHTFLAALTHELLGTTIPQAERATAFLRGRRRDDGGFVEIDPMTQSGANPTAAAVASLMMLDSISADEREGVASFLASLHNEEGGFLANSRIPIADALSTFTAYLTLVDLGRTAVVDASRVEKYILGLELPTGGFRGADWDKVADVEYSFYAVGTLALV